MAKKLIILYTANYCNKMKNLFGVEQLVKTHKVEFWNLSAITAKEKLASVHTDGLTEIEVKSHWHLIKLIRENIEFKPIYASVIGFCSYSCRLYMILSFFRCTFATVTNGVTPSVSIATKRKQLNDFFCISKYKRAILYRLVKFVEKCGFIKPADYTFLCCDKAEANYPVNDKTKIVNISSGDYADALNTGLSDNAVPHNYILFLDQYLPFHNDFILTGQNHVHESEYYRLINGFFDKVEKAYGCEIIVAAHPSANLYHMHNYYGGRSVVFNKTAELVKNCNGVIAHYSTSISFAVINRKPIIFLNMPGFSDLICQQIQIMAETLNSKICKLPSENETSFYVVNDTAYDKYLSDFLTKLPEGESNSSQIKKILDGIL